MGRASELGRPKTGVFRRLGRRALGASRVGKSRGIADLCPAARNPGRNQRPATLDPERPGPPGHLSNARLGPPGSDMSGSGFQFFFGLEHACMHSSVNTCTFDIDLISMYFVMVKIRVQHCGMSGGLRTKRAPASFLSDPRSRGFPPPGSPRHGAPRPERPSDRANPVRRPPGFLPRRPARHRRRAAPAIACVREQVRVAPPGGGTPTLCVGEVAALGS